MKNEYLGLIGLLIIISLIAGCSGPSTTPSDTHPTTTSGTGYVKIQPVRGMTASMTARPTTIDAGVITIFDKTKFTWYDFVQTGTENHWKYEYTTGTFHGQQAILKRSTLTYQQLPVQMILEVYTDSTGSVLGSVERHIMNGQVTEEEKSGSIYTFEYDTIFSRNDLKYEGTETVTVHAGTFICDKYFKPELSGSHSGTRYFISSQVPVPVKEEITIGVGGNYSMELWAWG